MEKNIIHGGDIYRNRIQHDFSVNINPLGMPLHVREAIRDAADLCEYYPDIRAEELRGAIGSVYGVLPEQILVGNGSSELLIAVVQALKPEKTVIPVPSFYGYERAALAADGEIRYIPMSKKHHFGIEDEEDLRRLTRMLTSDVSLLFLANPNNPTGRCIPPVLLEALLTHCLENEITVVLDECFLEFVEDGQRRSFLTHSERWPNLIVLRAFTKIFAMPGVRLGYLACADPKLRAQIERQLPEWNVSVPAQQAGLAAMEVLRETSYPEETIRLVKEEREHLADGLLEANTAVFPSEVNFLLLFSEAPLYERLLEKGILIRDCANFRGLEKGYYRVAVKERQENDLLLQALAEITEEGDR